eukprot:4111848-Alexandrium_andersonii.AAC.1
MARRDSRAQGGRCHPSRTRRSQRWPMRSKAFDWSAKRVAGQHEIPASSSSRINSQSTVAASPMT